MGCQDVLGLVSSMKDGRTNRHWRKVQVAPFALRVDPYTSTRLWFSVLEQRSVVARSSLRFGKIPNSKIQRNVWVPRRWQQVADVVERRCVIFATVMSYSLTEVL